MELISWRGILQRSNLFEKIGEENIYSTVNQAVYAFSKKYR